jgi:phosphopantetheinyl transferase
MALVQTFQPSKSSSIGLWKFAESIDSMRKKIDQLHYNTEKLSLLTSNARKVEWLSTRLLLQSLIQNNTSDILYDCNGKPYLSDSNTFISISHSKGMCALFLSTQPVGIDLQVYNSRIKTIENKYLNPSEISLIENEEDDLHYFWCAKEAVFKAHGRKKIYLKDHIFITQINRFEKTMKATLVDGQFEQDYLLKYLKIENYYLVYTSNV